MADSAALSNQIERQMNRAGKHKKPPFDGVQDGLNLVKGRLFVGEHILVDGCLFEDCEFIDCALGYSGGRPFFLTSNLTNGNMKGLTLEFIGEASNTLLALRAMYRLGMTEFVDRILETIKS